jgi:hypothetical protein
MIGLWLGFLEPMFEAWKPPSMRFSSEYEEWRIMKLQSGDEGGSVFERTKRQAHL